MIEHVLVLLMLVPLAPIALHALATHPFSMSFFFSGAEPLKLSCCPCSSPCAACQMLRHEGLVGKYSLCTYWGEPELVERGQAPVIMTGVNEMPTAQPVQPVQPVQAVPVAVPIAQGAPVEKVPDI